MIAKSSQCWQKDPKNTKLTSLQLFLTQFCAKCCRYTVCPKKKATIRFDSHSAQSHQNSFIFSDIEDIHQEFLLVKFEDH